MRHDAAQFVGPLRCEGKSLFRVSWRNRRVKKISAFLASSFNAKARLDGRDRGASLFLGSDSSASDMRFTYVFAPNRSENVSHRELFCIVSLSLCFFLESRDAPKYWNQIFGAR